MEGGGETARALWLAPTSRWVELEKYTWRLRSSVSLNEPAEVDVTLENECELAMCPKMRWWGSVWRPGHPAHGESAENDPK